MSEEFGYGENISVEKDGRHPQQAKRRPEYLHAIRECNPVEFDYTLVRHGGKVVHKKLKPHFLKIPYK